MSESSPAILTTQQRPGVPADGEQESDQDKVRRLERELQIRTEERENYKNRLHAAAKEITDMRSIAAEVVGDAVNAETIEKLRDDNNSLREALNKAAEIIKDKTDLCMSQERQNIALTNQVGSLKEVIKITKDLLNIRNMEVQHLQSDVDSMEEKIRMERERQSAMIAKMDQAVKLNAELKQEYENQLRIFQDLKNRYEERVVLLEKVNMEQKDLNQKLSVINGEHQSGSPKTLSRTNSVASDLDEFIDAAEGFGDGVSEEIVDQ